MTSELVASAGIELSYIHSGIDLARKKVYNSPGFDMAIFAYTES
jgi:hypothetical protein